VYSGDLAGGFSDFEMTYSSFTALAPPLVITKSLVTSGSDD